MTARVERLAGEICHCDWVNCPGCGIEFRLRNSYDFVGQLRAAGWGVDWSKDGWWCRECRRAAETGQGKLR